MMDHNSAPGLFVSPQKDRRRRDVEVPFEVPGTCKNSGSQSLFAVQPENRSAIATGKRALGFEEDSETPELIDDPQRPSKRPKSSKQGSNLRCSDRKGEQGPQLKASSRSVGGSHGSQLPSKRKDELTPLLPVNELLDFSVDQPVVTFQIPVAGTDPIIYKNYSVYRRLLEHYSVVLRTYLEENPNRKAIRWLKPVAPQIFAWVMNWLTTGRIHRADERPNLTQLSHLWALAGQMKIAHLQNACMDLLVIVIKKMTMIRVFIGFAYDEENKENRVPLQRLAVERLAELNAEDFESQMLEMPPTLKWDLMLAMKRHLDILPDTMKYRMKGGRRLHVSAEE